VALHSGSGCGDTVAVAVVTQWHFTVAVATQWHFTVPGQLCSYRNGVSELRTRCASDCTQCHGQCQGQSLCGLLCADCRWCGLCLTGFSFTDTSDLSFGVAAFEQTGTASDIHLANSSDAAGSSVLAAW